MGNLAEQFMKIMGGGGENGLLKGPQKKIITIMTVIVAIGILLIFVNGIFSSGTGSKVNEAPTAPKAAAAEKDTVSRLDGIEKDLGQKLSAVLCQIEGVGKVTAQVSLASSSELEYAINTSTSNKTTEEKDTKGGSRTITEVTKNGQLVMLKEVSGSKETPVVIKEIKPEIQGVIVIAEGAGDGQIKAEITDAVETYYHLPAHKVTVLPMESR